ncbi:MAG: peptide ABC transporter substrate-binding protein [Lachnospiraceae bacterium]
MKKRTLAVLMSAIMVASSLSGCGSSETTASTSTEESVVTAESETSEASDSEESVYRTLYSSEISTMNYLTTGTISNQAVAANTVDTLIEYDNTGTMEPSLAESWVYDADANTYTFTLRADQKWLNSDGEVVADVTAQDFVDAMAYVLDPENSSSTEWLLEGVILNAEEYYQALSDGEEMDFAEVGVKAIDDLTLEYTLAKEVPYFLSMLGYVCFMPAYGPLLEETGDTFATSAETMYYCGAYYVSSWVAQVEQVYTKNPYNWDVDNVYIDTLQQTYNAEASTIGPEMVKRGEIDYTSISSDLVDSWMSDSETADMISVTRDDPSYSYYYCFNFNIYKLDDSYARIGDELAIDEKYEPYNWEIAVNNENFRQAVMSAVNRLATVYVNTGDYADPTDYIMNTVTPTNNIVRDGGDAFSTLEPFTDIVAEDFFNVDEALVYKEAAMEELTQAGATFPIIMMVSYNPSVTNWEQECIVLEQQIEAVLGTDFIDVQVEAGPSENFLSTVRRSSNYMFMKCGWGGDYADPETWTDPFYQQLQDDGSYSAGMKYAYLAYAITDGLDSGDEVLEYFTLVETAKDIVGADQEAERFLAFAEAEAYLIDHAFVIPYGMSEKSYVVSKLDVFEGQFAASGVAGLRYKDMTIQDDYVSMDDYYANMAAIQ